MTQGCARPGHHGGAGLNVIPTALVVLGLGGLAFSLAPRAATPTVYTVVIAPLLIDTPADAPSGLSSASGYTTTWRWPAESVDAPTIVTWR
jgi:hypothetical protein